MYFDSVQDVLEKIKDPKIKQTVKQRLERDLQELDPDGVIRKYLKKEIDRPDISYLTNRPAKNKLKREELKKKDSSSKSSSNNSDKSKKSISKTNKIENNNNNNNNNNNRNKPSKVSDEDEEDYIDPTKALGPHLTVI